MHVDSHILGGLARKFRPISLLFFGGGKEQIGVADAMYIVK